MTQSTDEAAETEMRNERLLQLIADARARYDAMTPDQKARHDYEQRRSFVRGMCRMSATPEEKAEYDKAVDRLLPPLSAAPRTALPDAVERAICEMEAAATDEKKYGAYPGAVMRADDGELKTYYAGFSLTNLIEYFAEKLAVGGLLSTTPQAVEGKILAPFNPCL